MTASPPKSLARIREQTERIRGILATRDIAAPVPRSAWCVAEHLDHTIKVASATIQVLLKPSNPTLSHGINIPGRLVLIFGWIPRGRGRAPEKLTGTPETADALRARLAELDALTERALAATTPDGIPILRHPMFGGLTFSESLAFIVIHTNHHLKIIG
jgi:hypothetical protein